MQEKSIYLNGKKGKKEDFRTHANSILFFLSF